MLNDCPECGSKWGQPHKPECSRSTESMAKADRLTDEDLFHNDQAVCPYCGHQILPPEHDMYMGEDDEEDFECPQCEREFTIRASVTIHYTTKKIDQESDTQEVL